MTDEWWQLNEKELSSNGEAQAAKQVAYFNTFFGSDEAMQVLLDLTAECSKRVGSSDYTQGRLDVLDLIRANCGVGPDAEMAGLKAIGKLI